jgi:hypothetical protein
MTTCRVGPAGSDASARSRSDAALDARARQVSSLGSVSDVDARLCLWCRAVLPAAARRDSKFCGKRCRQSSWRFRVCRADIESTDRPMVFAYADPPYPGKASLYPEKTEVDHASLLERLTKNYPDGWALSTSSEALRDVLSLLPRWSQDLCVVQRAAPHQEPPRSGFVGAANRRRWPSVTGRCRSGPKRRIGRGRTLPTLPRRNGGNEAASFRRMDVPPTRSVACRSTRRFIPPVNKKSFAAGVRVWLRTGRWAHRLAKRRPLPPLAISAPRNGLCPDRVEWEF